MPSKRDRDLTTRRNVPSLFRFEQQKLGAKQPTILNSFVFEFSRPCLTQTSAAMPQVSGLAVPQCLHKETGDGGPEGLWAGEPGWAAGFWCPKAAPKGPPSRNATCVVLRLVSLTKKDYPQKVGVLVAADFQENPHRTSDLSQLQFGNIWRVDPSDFMVLSEGREDPCLRVTGFSPRPVAKQALAIPGVGFFCFAYLVCPFPVGTAKRQPSCTATSPTRVPEIRRTRSGSRLPEAEFACGVLGFPRSGECSKGPLGKKDGHEMAEKVTYGFVGRQTC